jgi:hypothetical protein
MVGLCYYTLQMIEISSVHAIQIQKPTISDFTFPLPPQYPAATKRHKSTSKTDPKGRLPALYTFTYTLLVIVSMTR